MQAHIHTVKRDIDNSFSATGDPHIMFMSALEPNTPPVNLLEARLLLRTGSLVVRAAVRGRMPGAGARAWALLLVLVHYAFSARHDPGVLLAVPRRGLAHGSSLNPLR